MIIAVILLSYFDFTHFNVSRMDSLKNPLLKTKKKTDGIKLKIFIKVEIFILESPKQLKSIIITTATTRVIKKHSKINVIVKMLLNHKQNVSIHMSVYKKYQKYHGWSCIYKKRNQQWMKLEFSSKYNPWHSTDWFNIYNCV